jgi:DNA polymerase III subunit gamma/tau
MTFIVTARKWRPQLFDEVVGQQHITTTLKNAIENNRIGHAYIFAGPRGVGKTTTARILAKRLNCKNPNGGEPCNNCDACESFLKSQSLDIIEIDGASNRRIDEIRTLRESVKYAPTSGEYKVYIIDEVHMLTTESFNALLKTLEEPPEHTIFIFATTDIHKVPLTIISRCQRFDFRRIELTEIKSLISKIADTEKIQIDDESLTLIAKKADGALRDAESIFDQVVSFCGNKIDAQVLRQMLNIIDDEIYFQISESILSKKFSSAFEVSDKIYSNGWNFIDFNNGLIEHFRNITSVIVSKSADFLEVSENNKIRYLDYIEKFSEGDLIRILSFLSQTQNELKIAQNQKLKIEIALTKLISLEKSTTISEMLSKIGDIEEISSKKKTDFVEYFEVEQIVNKKISTFPQDKIESSPNIIEKTKEIKVSNLQQKEPSSIDEPLKIESIKLNWIDFTKQIAQERFTLAIIEHTIPSHIEKNVLIINVTHKEDVPILTSAGEFLTKKINIFFKCNIQLKFSLTKNNSNSESPTAEILSDSNDEFANNPLILSIKKELGGKEVK